MTFQKFSLPLGQSDASTKSEDQASSLSQTITVHKGAHAKGLGFTIVGGSDSEKGNLGIYVRRILPHGLIAEEGSIKEGKFKDLSVSLTFHLSVHPSVHLSLCLPFTFKSIGPKFNYQGKDLHGHQFKSVLWNTNSHLVYLNFLNTHSGNEEVILPRLLQNSHYFENGLVLC